MTKENEDKKTETPLSQSGLKELLGEVDKTARGFPYVRFHDRNGALCSLQNSSAVGDYDDSFERPGSSFVWLGPDDANPIIMARDAKRLGIETKEDCGWTEYDIPKEVSLTTRMHLNREQVQGLIERLQCWLGKGEFT